MTVESPGAAVSQLTTKLVGVDVLCVSQIVVIVAGPEASHGRAASNAVPSASLRPDASVGRLASTGWPAAPAPPSVAAPPIPPAPSGRSVPPLPPVPRPL